MRRLDCSNADESSCRCSGGRPVAVYLDGRLYETFTHVAADFSISNTPAGTRTRPRNLGKKGNAAAERRTERRTPTPTRPFTPC
jgi:hypothetical protein